MCAEKICIANATQKEVLVVHENAVSLTAGQWAWNGDCALQAWRIYEFSRSFANWCFRVDVTLG